MRSSAGFTLLELLLVVAIVAILVSLLVPSMSKARTDSKTVRCASNMRQIFTATQVYGNENDDWMLPAICGSSASYQADLWAGTEQLGPIWGIRKRIQTTEAGNRAALSLARMMDCPAVDHTDIVSAIDPTQKLPANQSWYYDYQYNQNLGCNLAYPGSGKPSPTFQSNGKYPDGSDIPMAFVRRPQLPRTTLLLTDDRDKSYPWDYVFATTRSLVPSVDVGLFGQAGIPHSFGTRANLLFADGQILLDDTNKLLKNGAPGSGANPNNWVINFRTPVNSNFPFQ